MTAVTFYEEVVERAGVSADLAERLTEATLRPFAERITGGEAEDLAARMPDGLRLYLSGTREVRPAGRPRPAPSDHVPHTPDRAEISVDTSGRIAINGWAEPEALDELLASLGVFVTTTS
ncbi:MAG TPA: DUF2267 domain-containing protein [Micromonosporaceae bacterium]|nr:DUF2267 domain-containing protein [Micromonosporaceae bacterium]